MPVHPLGRIWSTNSPAWRHDEVKRRTVDVGIFPNTAELPRLVRMLLAEQDENTGVADQNQEVGKPRITDKGSQRC